MITIGLILFLNGVFGFYNGNTGTDWELIETNKVEKSKMTKSLSNEIVQQKTFDIPLKSEIVEDLEELFVNSLLTQIASGNTSMINSGLPLMNGIKNANLIFPTESGYNIDSGGYTSLSGTYESVSIEVGLASELQAFPNQRPKIYFEVTNNQAQSILLLFKCEDAKGIIFTTWPLKSWLGAGEKTVVTVTLWTKGNADVVYQDQVTLHAISVSSKWEKSVLVYVNSQKNPEYTQPSITYDLVNDCYKVLVGSCQDATWSVEIVVQDSDSGLLRVTSDPIGVYFPFKYTTGTQHLVKGYYSASCCQSTVKITAIDLKMNMSTREISAYELKTWVIAVIVVSSIVLLALIIGLIVWIVIKRQKGSVDLPVYRGSRADTTA